MNNLPKPLSVVEKVGYSLGDLAANLIFQTLVVFLAFFYTDVYGIPATAAATIIFVGGLVGAFFNPIMGIIADRTVSRWGKFRPWILWTSVPFGISALLAFSTPAFSPEGKLAYALITYVLLVIIYSANNLPYAALSGVMTSNMKQRNSLSAYRFVAVMIAQFVIQVLLLPLVLILGDGDKAAGFNSLMTVFCVVGTVFFLITFFTTKERVILPSDYSGSVYQDIKDLIGNKPWLIMLSVTILVFVTLALKGGSSIYFFQYYLNNSATSEFLSNSGFNSGIAALNQWLTQAGLTKFEWPSDPATSAFSLFNAVGIITSIVGIGFSKPLADKFGKRDVFMTALFISTLFILGLFWVPSNNPAMAIGLNLLHGLFYGVTIPLLWAMIADVADYSEWRYRRRATAIIFSAMIFGLKLGLSIGGASVALLLAHFGYDPLLQTQSDDTIQGIKLIVSVFPTVPFFVATACLFTYRINRALEQQIENELSIRRAASS